MAFSSYETLEHADPSFPVIFHLDRLSALHATMNAHWHEGIELLYCVSGTARLVADTQTQIMRPGQLSVIPSGALHYTARENGTDCLYYCLIADPLLLSQTALPANLNIQRQVEDPAVTARYHQIIHEMETKEPFYKDAVKELVRLLFIELCRHWSSAGPSSPLPSRQPEMVKQAILYLRDHLHESLSVDDLCGQVGFSKYYFCHVFKKVTGRTVMDYANSLRCSQARQLLESGAYSISECAVRCGFSDLSYFTKVFKRQTGLLPSQVRQQAAAENTENKNFEKNT